MYLCDHLANKGILLLWNTKLDASLMCLLPWLVIWYEMGELRSVGPQSVAETAEKLSRPVR